MSSGPRKSKKVTARARRKAPARRPRAIVRKKAVSPPVAEPLALEFPFGVFFSEVRCLACGELVVSVDGCEPCPHLLYVYLDDICEPIFVQPVFEELLEESDRAQDDEGDELGFVDRVQQLLGTRPSATGCAWRSRPAARSGARSTSASSPKAWTRGSAGHRQAA